jgi:hypothetical protein
MMGICTVVAFRQRRITMPTFQKIEAICSTTIRRARIGALLARFVKNMLLALPVLLFAFEAIAGGCNGLREYYDIEDKERVDFVDFVQINGQSWTGFATIQQARALSGEKDAKVTVINVETDEEDCPSGGWVDTTIQYPDKRLVFSTYDGLMEDVEYSPSIFWDLRKFKDTLVVAGHTIRPDLTSAEFKKIFPHSARKNFALDFFGDIEREKEIYIVGINLWGSGGPTTCLDYGLGFVFSNGKLTGLSMENYGSLCGC